MVPKRARGEVEKPDATGRVNRLYAVLSKVNEAIVRVREPDELYEAACRIAVDDGGFILAWIGFVDPRSQYIQPRAIYGRDEGYLDTVRISLSEDVPEGRGPTGLALREGDAFINNDTANNPIMRPWREEQLKRGYRSSASFPLKAEGTTVGAITLYAGEPDYFDDEEVRLLERLADDFSFALESAEIARQRSAALAALKDSREELSVRVAETTASFEDLVEQRTRQAVYAEALNRISEGVHSTLELDEIMDRAMREITDVLDVDAAVVMVHKGDYWEFAYAHGLSADLLDSRLPDADVPISMEVSRTRAPVFVSDVASDDRVNIRTMDRFGITALMAVPLIIRGDVYGVLVVDRFGQPAPFTEQQLDFLQKAAATLSLGLENARLFAAEGEAQREAERQLSRTALLNAVAVAATTSTSLAEVADRVLRAIAEVVELKIGAIYLYDRSSQVLTLLAERGLERGYVDNVRVLDVDEASPTLVSRAVMERRVVSSDEVPMTDARRRMLREAGLTGVRNLAVPIESGGAVLGTVSFVFERDVSFSADELTMFGSLASIVGQAIENARLFEAEVAAQRRAERELETTSVLLAAADDLNKWTSLGSVLNALANAALNATAHQRVFVGVLDDDRSHMTFVANVGANALIRGKVVAWGELSAGLRGVLTEGKTKVVEYDLLPDEERGVLADPLESRAALLVPLVFDDRVLGHIALDDPGKQGDFTDREIELVEGIASQAAVAVQNARSYEALQEAARLGDALNAANKVIHSTLEIEQVMQHALETGVDALECDAAAIEMREGDEWVVRYQVGFPAEVLGTRLGNDEAPNATRMAQEAAPFAIEVMSGDEKVDVGFVRQHGLKSVLAVPLVARTEVVGCALFYTSTAFRRFVEAEIDFGRKLGSVVSLALENARLYEVEHRIAGTLQQALLSLPDSVPGVEFAAYYQSATESVLVGGDFYDIFELDDRHVGITIGDISGKGLDAAVLTALVRNTIRAHANESGKTSARILSLANDVVAKFTPVEAFATVFFGILDHRDGRLVYASAGHTTAAIVRHDGTLSRLAATGPILGAYAGIKFGQGEARLERREMLFLYTDGLTEARRDGELYGEARLFAALATARHTSARVAAETAVADVMTFAGNRLRDDLAILAVQRLESDEEPPA